MSERPGADEPTGETAVVPLTEAATLLDVHYMTAYRYVRTGRLRATKRGGQWWVTTEDLERFRASAGRGAPGRPSAGGARPVSEAQVWAFAERLVHADHAGAWAVIDDLSMRGRSIRDLYLDLLAPALRHIGDGWEAGRLSVGDEHRASVVVMRLIGRLGARVAPRGPSRGTVVLAAAPGDHHGLPTALLADLLRAEGLDVQDLGADTPAAEVAAAAASQDRLIGVGICATTSLDAPARTELARAVRLVHAGTGAPVLVGGAALSSGQEPAPRRLDLGADHLTTDATDAVAWFCELPGPRARQPHPPGYEG